MSNDLYNRIFIFSQQQFDLKMQIESKLGSKPKFGKVIVNGISRTFTDIIISIDKCRFTDATTLISGDIRKIKYIEAKDVV